MVSSPAGGFNLLQNFLIESDYLVVHVLDTCTRMLCREFYEHLRDWIIETELDRYRSGRVFEYMWAIMFGAPAVSEPLEECDLLTCTDEVGTRP